MFRLTCALLLISGPVYALSCKVPNFAEGFNRVAAAEEVYSLGYGRLKEIGPVPDYIRGKPREIAVEFVGKLMGSSNFGQTQTLHVTVITQCASAWCGPMPSTEEQMLVFLEQRNQELILTSHICPQDFHLSPSLGQVTAIRECMKALTCGDDEIKAFNPN